MTTYRTWLYFMVLSQCWLLVTPQSSVCKEELGIEYFDERDCHCTASTIVCSEASIDNFPVVDVILESVVKMRIEFGRFSTLNSSHLRQFPNLVDLIIRNGRLESVTDNAFEQVPKLTILDLSYNRIASFPKIAGLTNLERVYLQGNRIQSIEYDHVKQCIKLLTIILDYNNIEVLRSGTFSDSCRLSTLNISRNDDLHTIEEDFFDGLFMKNLDISFTKLSRLPLKGLSWLVNLNLEGCKRMKNFPLANEVYNEKVCVNKTFPFLKNVRFEYHAHCCSYNSFKPLVSNTGRNRIIPDQCNANTRNQRNAPPPVTPSSIVSSNPSTSITDEVPVSLFTSTATVCWKGSTLINEDSTVTLSTSDKSSSLKATSDSLDKCCTTTEVVITPTYTEVEVCSTPVATTSLEAIVLPMTTVSSTATSSSVIPTMTPTEPLPISCSQYPLNLVHACLYCTTQDFCQSSDCQFFNSVCQAGSGRRKRSISRQYCIENDCVSSGCIQFQHLCHGNRQKRMVSTVSIFSTTSSKHILQLCSTSTVNVVPSVLSFSLVCDSVTSTGGTISTSTSDILSSLHTTTSSSVTPTMTPTEPLPISCSQYPSNLFHACLHCTTQDFCQSSDCQFFNSVCQAGSSRRRRSIQHCMKTECESSECIQFQHLCHGNRQKKDLGIHPSCSSCTVKVISTFADVSSIIHTTTGATLSQTINVSHTNKAITSTATVPSNTFAPVAGSSQPTVTCFRLSVLSPHRYNENENITATCYPGNDPFNPCFHIMDDDILRVAIWLVLFIAIIGNGLVIALTILHWAIRYQSYKKEPNLLYILYLNLAIADSFMGLYLLTVASVDIETKGHYSADAVEWQTSAGCNFAGFCAIFSSVLSIYSLLFITIERVYSIKFALEMKHFKKKWVFIFMVFGWILAFFLAVLPIFDVNNYGRVSICLPFETRETVDIAYIAFVLIITGVASFIILICYVYLFYLVGCSSAKKKLTRSFSGKEELKLALRMSLLIVTDFATWGPIALFGLSAAFGYPLINDIKAAKVLMVFVFPLNSCLNPILYSFSTRLFRNNVLNMFRKCGMCKLCDQMSKSLLETNSTGKHSSTYRSSDAESNAGLHGLSRRRSTQGSILSRLTSLSSLNSDNIIGVGSRRGSTLSGSSLEEGSLPTTPNNASGGSIGSNKLAVPNGSSNGGTHLSLSKSSWNSTGSLSNSSSRLKSLPEESEEAPDHVNHIIPIRKDSTDSNCSTSLRKIVIINEASNLSKDIVVSSKRRQSLPTILDNNHEDTIELPTIFKPIRGKDSKVIFIDHKSAFTENAEIQQMEVNFF